MIQLRNSSKNCLLHPEIIHEHTNTNYITIDTENENKMYIYCEECLPSKKDVICMGCIEKEYDISLRIKDKDYINQIKEILKKTKKDILME